MGTITTLANYAAAIQFIRKLAVPITSTEAFRRGIIDKNGNRTSKPLTSQDKSYWSYIDVICNNLKKLLAKIPNGSSRVATIAACMLLLKEENIQEDRLESIFNEYLIEYSLLFEDGTTIAVNNTGNVAGIGGSNSNPEPGVYPKKKHKYKVANKKEELKISKLVFGLVKR